MILISPYAAKLQSGKRNPKNYPFWQELIKLIPENVHVVQVGVNGEEQLVPDFRKNLPVQELRNLLRACKTWIGCDSMFQHLAWDEKKKGIVLWSVSDPVIYGHPENINLLKSRDYVSPNQFFWWDFVEHKNECFVEPEIVIRHITEFL